MWSFSCKESLHSRIQKIIKEQIKVKGVRVMQIDEIPRNAFGKIRYAALPKRELVTI